MTSNPADKSYHQNVIVKGDAASSNLGTLADETRRFPSEDIRNISYGKGSSVNLLFPPKNMDLVAIPVCGRHSITGAYDSAFYFIQDAKNKAFQIEAHPVAITDVLDMSSINLDIIPALKVGLKEGARCSRLWVANGETAGLGDRVTVPFNISGMVLAYVKKGKYSYGVHSAEGFQFAVAPHNGMGVNMNSDGNGTKPEWHARLNDLGLSFAKLLVQDGSAMLYDDGIKINARIIIDGRILELGKKGGGVAEAVQAEVDRITKKSGIPTILKVSYAGDRISGYGKYPMNLSGTTISLVDEESIKKLPHPSSGEHVMGFYNRLCRNLRANGITDQRKTITERYGKHWHRERLGLLLGVSAPATVFYNFFRELFAADLTTQVGHFSGGAYEGKFAKPLGKWGLGADLSIDGHEFPLQDFLMELQGQSLETICRKQPYRLEAWATTQDPKRVIEIARKYGYEAIDLGKTKKMAEPRLTMTFKDLGERVSFAGR